MDEKEISENAEASVVLVATVCSGVTGFVAALPLPIEWKVPIASFSGVVTSAILAYWKAKINKK